MTQSGRVVGDVEFRPGDGAKMPIPKGRIEVETSDSEATLSWEDGEARGAATIPLNEFAKYVREGAIRLN
jgi:hypothetical protein